MRHPSDRKWQKDCRIYDRSIRTERAKQNLALTTQQLVKQQLKGNVQFREHQKVSEPWYTLENPNPLRVPTADLIDFQNHVNDLRQSLNNAQSDYNNLVAQLQQSSVPTSSPMSANTAPQQ